MRISDWSSDVCSSELRDQRPGGGGGAGGGAEDALRRSRGGGPRPDEGRGQGRGDGRFPIRRTVCSGCNDGDRGRRQRAQRHADARRGGRSFWPCPARSEEHTSELQSLMRISYAVFCLKKKTTQ